MKKNDCSKTKKYRVDLYYNCSARYYVDAKNKSEAYEKALKMDWDLPLEDWYNHIRMELNDSLIVEED